MASSGFLFHALFFALFALLTSPSYSLTCTSQKFKGNKIFANCTDLPELDAYLHFTYNASNSSLSIAFIASPTKPDGWVAWAINPTSTGMVGSQALIAFKSGGSLTVKTYNVSSYSSIKESKLSFDVWDMRAETDGKNIVTYASVKVPEKAETVNQVWQTGPSVTDGRPDKHDFGGSHLNSKGVLKLAGESPNVEPAPGSPPPVSPSEGPPDDHNGRASGTRMWNSAFSAGFGVLIASFVGFRLW